MDKNLFKEKLHAEAQRITGVDVFSRTRKRGIIQIRQTIQLILRQDKLLTFAQIGKICSSNCTPFSHATVFINCKTITNISYLPGINELRMKWEIIIDDLKFECAKIERDQAEMLRKALALLESQQNLTKSINENS